LLIDVISTLRMLVEIALFSLIGQGVLFALSGPGREQNVFYLVLKTLASPAVRFARFISPKFVVNQHIGYVALFLLLVLWLGLGVGRQIAEAYLMSLEAS
jgi:hypothetical protein